MARNHNYYVYIMSSRTGVLYTGFTNNIIRRSWEHKHDMIEGFSKSYKCHILVYVECFNQVLEAIGREKQLKRWRREKKVVLIKKTNPKWDDLSEKWK